MASKVKAIVIPCLTCILFFDWSSCMFYNAYTDTGTIIGVIEDIFYRKNSYKIASFRGIPYSEEINQWSRFRKLRLREAFQKPYNATYFRPACLQTGPGSSSQQTSEDCLFLNIFAPAESTINPVKKFPVLIYIHDGDFTIGSANDVSPEILSVAGDMIVVTLNYRLGVFGFLNSGNSYAQGNFGLWDQHLAIRWVRYNIAAFGGDVKNITVMGQSAGAASVLFHALYPGNRGLFQRVIALSGTCLSPWALHSTNLREVAKELKCLNNDTLFSFSDEPLLECIRNKPATEILNAGVLLDNIGPTIDGEFLIAHPYKILSLENNTYHDANNFFRSLDIVLGTTDNDGSQALVSLVSTELGISAGKPFSVMSDEIEQILVPNILEPVFRKHELFHNYSLDIQTRNNILHLTLFQYNNWTDPDPNRIMRENLLQLSTDVNYVIPVVEIADAHSYTNYNSSTYIYQFVHKPSYNIMAQGWIKGAGHGAETLFIFGFAPKMVNALGLTPGQIPATELDLADNMMRWIANFARTGSPNRPLNLVGFENTTILWPNYSDERPFLQISSNMTSSRSQRTRFGEPATSFWTTLVPVLLQSAKPPLNEVDQSGTVFTAFRIQSEKIEIVIISLIMVSCGLLVIAVLFFICACRFYMHRSLNNQ